MSKGEKKFPSYFPENCPPSDAKHEELIVFRMGKNNPAEESDFYPHVIVFPEKFKNTNNLLVYGISVFSDLDEMIKCQKAIPALKKMKFRYQGITYKHTGVVKRTPKNNKAHITWWLYDGVNPHEFFKLV